jgi:geranylgeranyl pyrophosphate synthase
MQKNPFDKYAVHIFHVQQLMQFELEHWKTASTEPLFDQASNFLQRPAKYIRPLTITMLCKQFGGNLEKAYACGAAVEIYHNATLIYDDIQDNSDVRRSQPSMHTSTNLSLAMSIGAITRALMYHPIQRCSAFSSEERVYIHRVLDQACTQVATGQGLEVLWRYQDRWDIQEQEYFEMIKGKTAALFSACFTLGSYISQTNPEVIHEMQQFGLDLGILFQLKNDYLDLSENKVAIGRNAHEDLREGKRTLFVIRAVQALRDRSHNEAAERLIAILKQDDDLSNAEITWCLDVFHDTRSVHTVKAQIEKYFFEIEDKLMRIELPSELKNDLETLIYFLATYGN